MSASFFKHIAVRVVLNIPTSLRAFYTHGYWMSPYVSLKNIMVGKKASLAAGTQHGMINQADKNGNCNLLVTTKTPVVSVPPLTN